MEIFWVECLNGTENIKVMHATRAECLVLTENDYP